MSQILRKAGPLWARFAWLLFWSVPTKPTGIISTAYQSLAFRYGLSTRGVSAAKNQCQP